MLLHDWPGEFDAMSLGPLVEDVGELACAVVGCVCGDVVQRRDCVNETVGCDWFAGGPVVPGVQGVDVGFGG